MPIDVYTPPLKPIDAYMHRIELAQLNQPQNLSYNRLSTCANI